MSKRRRKQIVERIKSLLIVLLSCSAVYLVVLTQSIAVPSGLLSRPSTGGGGLAVADPAETARPLRMAAVIPAGGNEVQRFGVQYSEADTADLFQQAYTILVEALSSANQLKEVTEAEWRQALSAAPGLYFDWQGEVPLEVLDGWLSVENPMLTGSVRRMVLAAREGAGTPDFAAFMARAQEELASSRPTAVNLFWALDRMEACWRAWGPDLPRLEREAQAIHREDLEMNRAMGRFGAELVPQGARILTHCNAGALATGGYGTALGVIRAAHEAGKVNMVYCDETRPLLQGARLTAYELVSDHIPATLIADNMAASLMAKGKIDLAVVGCDRMAANGDFANKIGTYSVAVNAHYHGIPFYVALPCSTIDLSLADGSGIPIEERDRDEVRTLYGTRTAPESVEVCNPAFDVTPHSLVTGIITEKGVIYPPFQENLQKLFG